MLELRKIVKDYPAGDGLVNALKGIDLSFRKNEFVSILGPSGCGKTTMLNIIGGLDQYTSGDLIINGRSTKDFKDRDWDAYRNHSIGFVFQGYNLIPHQTVLQNVEIALTLSGVSKTERKDRAKQALEQVGLGDQLHKKPNQISGGQMQRVAIARALVNDPDIILADEPTGALDTETSVQVMDILKEISRSRLVIMVTHNPDLAQRYSSRIIRMLDGKITDDSAPLAAEEYQSAIQQDQIRGGSGNDKGQAAHPAAKTKKPSMSFWTAFRLSLKNLFTKKGRTTLTAFAGSIGIMGISLILAVSQGTTAYIDSVQEDALSSYPLTIEKTSVDMTSLMETFMKVNNPEINHDKDAVYKKSAIYDMLTSLNNLESRENDLKSFKEYLEQELSADAASGGSGESRLSSAEDGLSQAITGTQYSYDLDLLVYTKNIDGSIIHSDTQALLQELMSEYLGADMSSLTSLTGSSSLGSSSPMLSMGSSMGMVSMNLWQEMLSGKNGEPVNDLLKKQYDVVYGTWPNSSNEIVLVLDKNNELDDMTLYALGLESREAIDAIMDAALNRSDLEMGEAKWSYEDICNMEFRIILNSDCYSYDEATGLYTDLRKTDAGLRYLYDNGLTLKVTGIIRPNENTQSAMLSGSIAYTKGLTEYVAAHARDSKVIEAQRSNSKTDILTGLPFKANTGNLSAAEKEKELRAYIAGMDVKAKASAYINIMSIPPQDQLEAMTADAMKGYTRADIESAMAQAITQQMSVEEERIQSYLSSMSDEEINELFAQSVAEQIKAQYAAQVQQQMSEMSPAQLAAAMDQALSAYTTEQCASYYDEIVVFSESTYEDNLMKMGYIDLESPSAINIYASSFANKDTIEEAISEYNKGVDELSQIKYTDYIGIMMASVTTIINAITYVLLAFVAISLVVSSIMIGVITLISVQERTKEIGILRAIGASKGDVSSMFNAETVIIGFASGLLGVGITYLLCIPINLILHSVTGILSLNAFLPLPAASVLILISVALSLIAGLIPSRSAAKKDPVVALRTE
ncbi:putative ABC transport system permease protein [Anaerotaenia torta]|uniref:ABC transporter ATP-binding protein/permease n=1 Tax=Anaerotaenia torta TaxID=433293 RepID=UPI003D22DAC4